MRATEFLNEDLSTDELQQVEKFADALWKKKGIDVDFTKHFSDRVNDPRNGKPISAAELVRIFKKEYERNGKDIETMDDPDAILKDKSTKINVPFALNKMYDKKNMVATTIMRKDNFYGKPGQPEFVVNEEDLNEIERLRKDDYTGGKGELAYINNPGKKKVKPLPGGSGLQYAIVPEGSRYTNIVIIDPNAVESAPTLGRYESRDAFARRLEKWKRTGGNTGPKIIAKLSIYGGNQIIPDAVKVGSITVDEDYRGMGIAKALYGIVLTIMKKPLVAGSEQTPGGRMNWMSLASIPGVEVKGYVQIEDETLEFASDDEVDKIHDTLMNLGGQFILRDMWAEYWAFDVLPGKGELKPAVQTAINTLYDKNGRAATGLYARWVGE